MRVAVVEGPTYFESLARAVHACGHSVVLIRGLPGTIYRGSDPTPSTLGFVDQTIECDLSSDGALHACIKKGSDSLGIDALIGIHELVVERVARVASILGFSFCQPEGLAKARDKFGMRETLFKTGASRIRSLKVTDLASLQTAVRQIGWPCVLKPIRGSASLSVMILQEPESVQSIWKRLAESFESWPRGIESILSREFVLEPYLRGQLVSLEAIRTQNITRLLSVSWRFRAHHDETIEIGTLMPAPCNDAVMKKLERFTERVVEAANLDRGIFHIEAILTEHGPELVELNPRLMGGSLPLLFERSFGINVFDALVPIYLSATPFDQPVENKGYSLSCFFGAIENGIMPAKVNTDFLENYRPLAPEMKFLVAPRGAYRKLDSNYSYLGRFLLTDKTVDNLFKARDEILALLEKSLGFSITKPEKGYGL